MRFWEWFRELDSLGKWELAAMYIMLPISWICSIAAIVLSVIKILG